VKDAAATGQIQASQVTRALLPAAFMLALLASWEAMVRLAAIPPYVLPSPSLIGTTLVKDWVLLSGSLIVTLTITLEGLALALAGGVGLALLFARSRTIEWVLYPYAVILQVTPIIAIAPLLLIYTSSETTVLICAWIVAFFPILSNTTTGLRSADRNLLALFSLYGASGWQTLWHLRLRSALPYLLAGLRIGGGLALIGAVVAEIAAGSAGAGSGLAYRIVEAQYRLNIPRMFAALVLLAVAGIAIFAALSGLSYLLLRRWHESALSPSER
jgi:NitT/TauT family transport system permease protein